MRCALILSLFFGVAAARRAPPVTAAESLKPASAIIGGPPHWGYPYGWGLDDSYFGGPEEFKLQVKPEKEEPVKEVQQVQRQVPAEKLAMNSPEHYPLPGWFGVSTELENKALSWLRSSHIDEGVKEPLDGLE